MGKQDVINIIRDTKPELQASVRSGY